MCNNGMALSLNDSTFTALKSDFDSIIGRTIWNMEMKGAEEAIITVKLTVGLEKTSVPVDNGVRDITRPTFKHDISSVMQVKDKMSGQLKGDYELVYDKESGSYYMQRVDDGQINIFDEDGKIIEADFQEVPAIGEGPRGLPAAAQDADYTDVESTPGEEDGAATKDAGGFEGASEGNCDPKTPFGWLRQFVGEDMRVTEAMGNFTVRTEENKVVLSSATRETSPFYCPSEKLEPHVGHQITCVGYGEDELVNISIECRDCDEVLFNIDRPGSVDAADEGDTPDDDNTSGYKYEAPDSEEGE